MTTYRGLVNFIGDIRECQTNLEEKEIIDEELLKIENIFNEDNISTYSNVKYLWKILFISILGYDVKPSIGFEKCLKLIQSSKLKEVSASYVGIVLFSSYPAHSNKIINNDKFIQTLKKHLSLPLNNNNNKSNTNNMFYKIFALRCLANLCTISTEFSKHFIDIVESICFVDNKNNRSDNNYDYNKELIKKSLLVLNRLIAVNNDYLINIKNHKESITSLLENTNYGITNSALCLFNTMLKNRYIIKQKQIEIIVKGYLGKIEMNDNYMIMTQIPNIVISILCNYYPGPNTEEYVELMESIVKQLDRLVINRESPKDYIYYQIPSPWTQVKLLKILQYFDAPNDSSYNMRKIKDKLKDVLQRIITKTEVTQSVNRNHAEHGILFEAINLICHYHDDNLCLEQVKNKLTQFINVRESNIRYLGLLGLEKMGIASKKHNCLPDYQRYWKRHLRTIQYSLDDGDPSIKSASFNVLIQILGESNFHELYDQILRFSKVASPQHYPKLAERIIDIINSIKEEQEIDEKEIINYDKKVEIWDEKAVRLWCRNKENGIEFFGEYLLPQLKNDKHFTMDKVSSIMEYISMILSDEKNIKIGFVDKNDIINDDQLKDINLTYNDQLETDKIMNNIDNIYMIWKLQGDKQYNFVLKYNNSFSDFIDKSPRDQTLHILTMMKLISLKENGADDDNNDNEIEDKFIKTLSSNCSESFQLFNIATIYNILLENKWELCDKLSVIILCGRLLILFGHLLVKRFQIDIVTQFNQLNKYFVGDDSKLLSKIYDEFVEKFPNDINESMILKANRNKKHDKEEKKKEEKEEEFISLKINDIQDQEIAIISNMKKTDTVDTLKNKITEMVGYKVKNQMLYFGDTRLKGTDNIEIKEEGQEIELQLVIRYGADSASTNNQADGNDNDIDDFDDEKFEKFQQDMRKRKERREMNSFKRRILEIIEMIECSKEFALMFCGLSCMLLMLFILGAGVDLVAMIIASEKRRRDARCSNISDHLLMNPIDFILVGAIFGFINLFLICCHVQYNWKDNYKLRYVFKIFHYLIILINIFIPIWCIIGFVEYGQLSSSYTNCFENMVGDIIISWSIIKLLSAFIFLCCIFKGREGMSQSLSDFCGSISFDNLFEFDNKTSYAFGTICIGIISSIDIAAICVAGTKYDDNNGLYDDDDLFMDPITFLMIAGIMGLINICRFSCVIFQIKKLEYCYKGYFDYQSGLKKIWYYVLKYIYPTLWMLYDMFIGSWCIVGLVLFARIGYKDIVSDVIISWSIIRLVCGCCGCSCILNYFVMNADE